MSVALYMDHHVPSAVTEGLRRRGIDVRTAEEDASAELDDERLLARVTQLNRVLYTQDEDFLAIANRWLRDQRTFAGLIYGHQLRVPIGTAIADLELIARVGEPEDTRNRVYFLPL